MLPQRIIHNFQNVNNQTIDSFIPFMSISNLAFRLLGTILYHELNSHLHLEPIIKSSMTLSQKRSMVFNFWCELQSARLDALVLHCKRV